LPSHARADSDMRPDRATRPTMSRSAVLVAGCGIETSPLCNGLVPCRALPGAARFRAESARGRRADQAGRRRPPPGPPWPPRRPSSSRAPSRTRAPHPRRRRLRHGTRTRSPDAHRRHLGHPRILTRTQSNAPRVTAPSSSPDQGPLYVASPKAATYPHLRCHEVDLEELGPPQLTGANHDHRLAPSAEGLPRTLP
jgi:hypothetical protein